MIFTESNLIAKDAKILSKEDFFEKYNIKEKESSIYNLLVSAKVGHITIEQIMGSKVGFVFSGSTVTFNKGISLFIDRMFESYYTSVIEKINWKEKYFDTENSRYKFEFYEQNDLIYD